MAQDSLQQGREALARRAWDEAFHHLSEADATGQLDPEDLDGLAEAAWASGHLDAYLPARERAYSRYLDQGNAFKAASMALQLAADYFPRGDYAVASGWRVTAERLLEGEPERVEHGRLALNRAYVALILADFDEAERQAQLAFDIGKRFGDRSISAWALSIEGQALTRKGELENGMKLIDEAMVSAVSGDLSPYVTSRLFCQTILTCQLVSDFGRAGEWIKATDRSSVNQGIHAFSGDCRVHKADLLRMRGDWAEAEAEARCACSQLEGDNYLHTGWALYELGEIQRLRGELGPAEESFELANEFGFPAQSGLALLRLAEGKIEAAEELIAGALGNIFVADPLIRAGLLPVRVEIAIAAGNIEAARAAADELESFAETNRTTASKAAAERARGAVHLTEGDLSEAVTSLRRGLKLWQEAKCPYEAAKTRMLLVKAYSAQGNEESSRVELRSARSAFNRLGAAADAQRAAELLGEEPDAKSAEVSRALKTFMFTDIVRSTELIEAMGDEAWQDLIDWHDQMLRSLFTAHSGEEVKHAGDGFFVAFNDSKRAFECSIAIQKTLAAHRKAHGFAPQVRIGLHRDEATKSGRDYMGSGVNKAARIAAVAEAGEILASEGTVDTNLTRASVSEARPVRLKGITASARLVTIDWRRA